MRKFIVLAYLALFQIAFCLLTVFFAPISAAPYPFYDFTKASTSLTIKIAVLGVDNRHPVPRKYLSTAAAIGILGQPGKRGWSCTAFCVAPNIIATNAHCIVRNPTAGRRLDLGKTIFVLPAITGRKIKTNFPSAITYPEIVSRKQPGLSVYGGNFIRPDSVAAQNHDWAFTKIRRNICKGRILKFSKHKITNLMAAAKNNQLFMIGFHGDKKMQDRLYSAKCRIRSPQNSKFFLRSQRRMMARNASLLPHTCDAFKGSSGSPILLETKSGIHVVGINLGSLRYERYQIKRNPYTGKIIGKRKIKYRRETNMAVRPSAFLSGLARFESETLIKTVSNFKTIQQRLKFLKLYKGNVDGQMGQKTRRAIVKYEKLFNLAPIAMPTKELLRHLENTIDTMKKTANPVDKDI